MFSRKLRIAAAVAAVVATGLIGGAVSAQAVDVTKTGCPKLGGTTSTSSLTTLSCGVEQLGVRWQ